MNIFSLCTSLLSLFILGSCEYFIIRVDVDEDPASFENIFVRLYKGTTWTKWRIIDISLSGCDCLLWFNEDFGDADAIEKFET